MSQFYTVLKADPLGEPYTPSFSGAKATQTYWCQLEGVDKDVSIGKQVPNVLTPGQHVYGDLLYAKSQKGNEYWKFKSAKIPDGVQRPVDTPSTPAQATAQQSVGMSDTVPAWFMPVANQIDYIFKQMKAMDNDKPTEQDNLHQVVSEEPEHAYDEDTLKSIQDIFSKPETPEDI